MTNYEKACNIIQVVSEQDTVSDDLMICKHGNASFQYIVRQNWMIEKIQKMLDKIFCMR